MTLSRGLSLNKDDGQNILKTFKNRHTDNSEQIPGGATEVGENNVSVEQQSIGLRHQ